MILKKQYYPFLMIVVILLPLLFLGFQGCGQSNSQEEEGGVTPESIVVARFVEFRGPLPSGLYEMDIEILQSHDIEGAENPTKDMVGKTITVLTMQGEYAILPGEAITASVGLYGEIGVDVLFARGLQPANIEEK